MKKESLEGYIENKWELKMEYFPMPRDFKWAHHNIVYLEIPKYWTEKDCKKVRITIEEIE